MSRALISLIFELCSTWFASVHIDHSFIFNQKEIKEHNSIIFTLYNFFELNWIKMKNFLLIILNNLNSIYGPFLNKIFFYSIVLKNCISYSEYWIEQYSHCTKIVDIIFEFNWIKKIIFPIHNSELSSIHRKC